MREYTKDEKEWVIKFKKLMSEGPESLCVNIHHGTMSIDVVHENGITEYKEEVETEVQLEGYTY